MPPERAAATGLDVDGAESASFQGRRVSDVGEGRCDRLVSGDWPRLKALGSRVPRVSDCGFDQPPHPAAAPLLAGDEETGKKPGRPRVDWLLRWRGEHACVVLAGTELAPGSRQAVGVSDESGRGALLHLVLESQSVAFTATLFPFRAALAPVLAPAACACAAAAEQSFDIRPTLGRQWMNDVCGHLASHPESGFSIISLPAGPRALV